MINDNEIFWDLDTIIGFLVIIVVMYLPIILDRKTGFTEQTVKSNKFKSKNSKQNRKLPNPKIQSKV